MTFAEKSLSLNFISLKSIHCVLLFNSMLGLLQGRKKKLICSYLARHGADPFSDDLCSLNFLTVIITMTQKKRLRTVFTEKYFSKVFSF